MVIGADEYASRHQRLRQVLERENLDAIIAYSTAKVTANVRYLTRYFVRFTGMQTRADGDYYMFGSCAALFPRQGEPILRTDQPWDVARAKDVAIIDDVDYASQFASAFVAEIASRGYRRIGIDNWYLFPAHEYLAFTELAPGVEFVPTRLLSENRRVKSPAEIEIMRRAAALGDSAVESALDTVKVGGNEYDAMLLCEQLMREGGDAELGSQSIAGCGPNSASGSHLPSRSETRTIEAGEWVMLDVTPRIEGYCSDISRHRLAGDESDLDPSLKRLYDACLLMSQEVRKAVRPGISGLQLNRLAEEIADQEGVREYKIDLLGHGVGLDIHDVPDYYYDNTPLSAGEIITVEPCLLIPGVAGVRIEDCVLVTEDGSEVLTTLDRELGA